MFNTMATSSMVLFLAVASNVFGAIFARLGSATVITNALTGLPVPPFVTLLLVMALIFLLGWPFEWPAIIFVFIPIFYPVIAALKYDMVWFGALVAVNLQTAYLSPPVAMSAYYLKQVVPQWSLGTIYRGHGGLHGHPGHRAAPGDGLPRDRALVPPLALRGLSA